MKIAYTVFIHFVSVALGLIAGFFLFGFAVEYEAPKNFFSFWSKLKYTSDVFISISFLLGLITLSYLFVRTKENLHKKTHSVLRKVLNALFYCSSLLLLGSFFWSMRNSYASFSAYETYMLRIILLGFALEVAFLNFPKGFKFDVLLSFLFTVYFLGTVMLSFLYFFNTLTF